MKSFLKHVSNRWGFDGWAVQPSGGPIAPWTVSTTREEVRALCRQNPDLFQRDAKIVKVKITVEAV